MSSELDLSPLELAILTRINEARAAHLVRTGEDYRWSDLMRAMGWSQTVTSQVKTGKRAVQLPELPLLARALGVRVEWLTYGSGEMLAPKAPVVRDAGREPERVVSVRPIAASKPQTPPAKTRRAR